MIIYFVYSVNTTWKYSSPLDQKSFQGAYRRFSFLVLSQHSLASFYGAFFCLLLTHIFCRLWIAHRNGLRQAMPDLQPIFPLTYFPFSRNISRVGIVHHNGLHKAVHNLQHDTFLHSFTLHPFPTLIFRQKKAAFQRQ